MSLLLLLMVLCSDFAFDIDARNYRTHPSLSEYTTCFWK